MARISWVVLLFVLAVVTSSAQTESVRAMARGGFQHYGFEGEATGSVSGEIVLGKKPSAELMIVLKDASGVTQDAQHEAIIFLKSISKSKLSGNILTVVGKGTFQGEDRDIEITMTDAMRKGEKDKLDVKVIRFGRAEFQYSANLDANSIKVSRGR